MKNIIKIFLLLSTVFTTLAFASTDTNISSNDLLQKPLIERYVLDELKEIRTDQLKLRIDVTKQITSTELSVSDRAIQYTSNTVNNIFYIIAAVSSLLLIIGFKSFKDLNENSEYLVEEKISELSEKFENRLLDIEKDAKQRFEQVTINQEQIEKTQKKSSLWKRAQIEENMHERLNLYDEILKLDPDDVETLVYKADTLLDLNEILWALSLCNHAITVDNDYALSYWQRACAHAKLDKIDFALEDIEQALSIAPNLKEELEKEESFKILYKNNIFKQFMV